MDWKYAKKDAIKKFAPAPVPPVTVTVAITETNSKTITVKDSGNKAVTAAGGKYALTVGETYTVSSTGYVDQTFVATAGMTTKSITLVAM